MVKLVTKSIVVLCVLMLGANSSINAQVQYNLEVHTFKGMNGESHEIEVYTPSKEKYSGKRPCAIFFHGGAWGGGSLDQFRGLSKYLASRGMVALTANYSMRKKSKEGKWLGLSEGESRKRICVIDGKSVIRWTKEHIKDFNIDKKRIVAGGASAGGHIAVLSMMDDAYNNPKDQKNINTDVKAFLLYCPAFTLTERDRTPDVNVFNHMDKKLPPMLFLVGETDNWKKASDVLFEKLVSKGTDVQYWEASKAGHMFFREKDWLDIWYKKTDDFLVEKGMLDGKPSISVLPSQAEQIKLIK